MDALRSVGRGAMESLRGLTRKRPLEEAPPVGKEALEEPVGEERRTKRARRAEPALEVSFSEQLVSPLRAVWGWVTGGGARAGGGGGRRLAFPPAGPTATIQAAAPTRLATSRGKETDEVQLIKVVNPRLEQAAEPGPSLLYDPLPDFTFSSPPAPAAAAPPTPGRHIRTGHERAREAAHLAAPDLKKRLKAGQVSGGHRSVYSRLFSDDWRRQQRATDYCARLGERELYRQILQSKLGGSAAAAFPPAPAVWAPGTTGRSPIFPRPRPSPRPVTSTVLKAPASPAPRSHAGLEASPVLGRSAARGVEEVSPPGREVPGRAAAVEEVLSPGFLAGLREKYDAVARETERRIRREEVKRDFHHDQNQQAAELVEERLKDYLAITQVAFDPEAEATLGPVEPAPITQDMEEVIRRAERAGGATLVEAFNIPITGRDIHTLRGLNWLNDEIINFYMQMIVKRSEGEGPKVWAFSTFFYPKLIDGNHASVKRWTKKVDLFSQALVLVPVHLGMHWCLAVIDVERKAIEYYDSMGGNNSRCLKALTTYVSEEHKAKRGSSLDMTTWTQTLMKDIPQQMNGSDCGMFACKFSEYISRRARISFTQEHMPLFRRRMIFEIVKNSLMSP